MVRMSMSAAEAVDGLPLGVVPPTGSGDGREQLLDVLRAGGLRYRAGARWRTAH